MYKKLRNTISLLILIAPFFVWAQADTTGTYYNPNKGKAAKRQQEISRRNTYSIDMGTYFSVGDGASTNGYYVNPQATIPVGKKLDMTIGMSFTQSYYSGTDFIPFPHSNSLGNTSDAILYAAASYYVNDRLTVHASAFNNFSSNPSPFAPKRGFSVGADYQISRRAWISFNYTYQEGGMPYGYGFGYPYSSGLGRHNRFTQPSFFY